MTYKDAGVDIELEFRAISSLIRSLEREKTADRPLTHHFTGLIPFGEHYLTLCTDGVGTKVLLAMEMGWFETIGIDCIAMNVNDMICAGARPLAFVDYLAMERPDPEMASSIGKGLARGAEMAGIEIVGGETATLPDIVSGLDLSGACLGYVERDRVITGRGIQDGDVIIGLASTGPHSNGYTLIRKVLAGRMREKFEGRFLGEILLEPTAVYVRAIMDLIHRVEVHGLVHITGGGFRNLTRLKPSLCYVITDPLPVHPVFRLIADAGNIEGSEMYQTFNMGMGFAVILPEEEAKEALDILNHYHPSHLCGRVMKGSGVKIPSMRISLPAYM